MTRHLLLLTFVLFTTPIIAQDIYTVNFAIRDGTLADAIDQLEEQAPIRFYFQEEWIRGIRVSYQGENQPVQDVLDNILEYTPLGYIVFREQAYFLMPKTLLNIEFEREFYQARYQEELERVDDNVELKSIVAVGDSLQPSPSGRAQVTGQLIDAQTGEGIVASVVYIEELDITEITDIDGTFQINVPIGLYTLEFQSIGYGNSDQNIRVYGDGTVEIPLTSQAYKLQEIVVEEEGADRNVSSAQIGVASLSMREIKKLPSFLGEADVLKSLLSLPGVSSVGDGAIGINVRGGDVGQNLILMDDALLFNSSHVLGFFSAFNPDVVSKVNLYKGNIPAQYGGRLSSVLEVGIKDGNFQELEVQGGIGLAASRAMIQGPIIKDKTAFVLSGRASSVNWLLQRVKNPDVRSSEVDFYDYNVRLNHKFNQNSSLLLSYYQSYDQFRFADDYSYDWGTRLANAEWRQIYGTHWSSTTTIGYGEINNTYSEPEGVSSFILDNGLSYLKGKHNFLLTALDGHAINAGLEFIDYYLNDETLSPGNDISNIIKDVALKGRGREWGFYINDEFSIGSRFSFSVGLRYSLYQELGPGTQLTYPEDQPILSELAIDSIAFADGEEMVRYNGWEPRLSMRYRLNANSSVKLSYNRLYQYIHLISNTVAATPADIWQTSTAYIPPQKADSYSVGFFQNFGLNNWESSVEVYYKDISNTVEYRDFAQLLQNSFLESELISGVGQAYGD
jgi:hypothetical protein